MTSVPLPKTRIAVLPFRNTGQDKGDDYLAEGMTDELISSLSNFHELKVIARTSVTRYKETTKSVSEIGREVNVGTVLEGSVRRAGGNVRVIVRLVDAFSEDQVWSARFDWKLDSVILAQVEIAEKVAAALKVKLLVAERERLQRVGSESSAAYVSYLKGRAMLQKDRSEVTIRSAMGFFKEAIAQDPGYAKAFTGLADSYFLLGWYLYLPKREAFSKSNDALRAALRLDYDLAEAHASYGNLLLQDYEHGRAEEEFKRAISLDPSQPLAHSGYLACLGDTHRFQEALLEAKLLEDANPLSDVNSVNLSVLYSYLGMKEEASKLLQKIRRLDPKSPWADWGETVAEIWNSDFEKAATHLETYLAKMPEDFERFAVLGYLYGRQGKRAEARGVLERLGALETRGASGLAFSFAKVHLGLGDKEAFLDSLEEAFEERSLTLRWLSYLRMEEMVEGDDRYANVLRRAGVLQGGSKEDKGSPSPSEAGRGGQSWDLSDWTPKFTDQRTGKVFDYLIGAFIQDEFIDKLPVEKSGWRTLGELSHQTGVAKSLFFGYPSGSGIVLKDLMSSKVAELKVFEGERGRGGRVTRVRIAYERDDGIRRLVANQFRNKTIMGSAPTGRR